MPDLSERVGPRYRAIADALAADVASGKVAPGARLPTHRELADQLGLTVGTVTRAYAEATRRGLVKGEVGRGTFVRRGAEAWEAGTGEAGHDLSLNLPPPVVGDEAALHEGLVALAGHTDLARLFAYGPNAGAERHRSAGAAWMRRVGLEASPERVVVCAGGQHALTVVFLSMFEPGDVVLTEALTYPGVRTLASLLRLRLVGVPMDAEGLEPDALEAAARREGARGLYCVPTVQNPTTATMGAERRRRVAEVAQRFGLIVVEDDIHGHLAADAPAPLSVHAPETSFFIASTGKSLLPGLRVGYLATPPDRWERLGAAVRATAWMAAPALAEIASRWIEDGTAERMLEAKRAEAGARQALAKERLAPFSLRSHPCAYHAWLELPEPWRGEAFAEQAGRAGVRVAPAQEFVVGREPAPHAVRLSLGAPRRRAGLADALDCLARTLAEGPDAGMPMV